jgi:hypothetical protein
MKVKGGVKMLNLGKRLLYIFQVVKNLNILRIRTFKG